MAVAGRSGEYAANSVAGALREAVFVRLSASPDGDSLAAAGLLARALAARTIPFQASVVRTGAPTATDDTTRVLIGRDGPAEIALPALEKPASETAFEVCRELGTEPDPVLALAGMFAAGEFEGSAAFESAPERGLIEQRAGVAIPVADVADGLAHTTLAHAPFSGDSEATAAALDGCDIADTDDGRRRVASVLALSVANTEGSTPRAAEAVGCALRPYEITASNDDSSVEFETVGGYADVLRANAREQPGTGLALALGHDAREAALTVWRTHGKRAHAALRNGTTERYRNVFAARVGADAPLTTTARLLCDFRSPEPVALALCETRAAAAAHEDANLGRRMAEAGTAANGDGEGERTARTGFLREFGDIRRGVPRGDTMKHATLRTESNNAELVAAALVPDNTEEMDTEVDGDTIETRLTRETTGGLRATVDDYVVNLSVAERVVQMAAGRTGTNDRPADDTQS